VDAVFSIQPPLWPFWASKPAFSAFLSPGTPFALFTFITPLLEANQNKRGYAVFHTIEFTGNVTIDLEVSPKTPRERLPIQVGLRKNAQIKPYVVETPDGPVEVADLFFDDGTATRSIPYEIFSFVDN